MTVDEQIVYLTKGCVDIVRAGELKAKLERSRQSGTPLVVKVGFDPTAPDLHLGHTVLIRKMKHFQDLGHRVIFLIGDFTGLIGDPTGRSKTRPALTAAEIEQNAETYKSQVFKILDRDKTIVDFNSRWLAPLGVEGMIRLAARYNVAQMLERRDFRQRYESGKPIAVHEFLYPLAQAYDSVFLRADVELGGTDQLFNLNVGRDIMPSYGLEAQVVMTTPLLEGLDGVEKMSKSLGNYIGVTEPAGEIFGKVMSISDALMWRYYLLLTDLGSSEIEQLEAQVASGGVHPMDAKKQLAAMIVRDLHGPAAAEEARGVWVRSHSVSAGDQLELALGAPVTIPVPPEGITVERVLVETGLAESGSDAGRKIKQGGVAMSDGSVKFLNDLQRFTTERHRLKAPSTITVRVGRKALVVTLAPA